MDQRLQVKLITGGVVLAVLVLAVGIRLLQLLPYPKGDYNWVVSPNERHRAYVYRLTDKTFFGREEFRYRFKVDMGLPGREGFMTVYDEDIPRYQITREIDMLSLEDVISWNAMSSRVTFDIGTRVIEARVPF